MAKKMKMSDTAGIGYLHSPTLYIDFDDLEELKGLTLGEEVVVVVKGKVKSVEQRESYDDPKKKIGSICLKDFEAEITSDLSIFESLMDEDD